MSKLCQSLRNTPEQGAVILDDWIVTITPVIGSLTASASSWLEEILRQVHSHYSLWLCSDPVPRLTIRQQAIEAGTTAASEARCALLSQRVTNLLLEAVPSAVKAEVVTVRALTPVGILFLLHTRYQPAGQAEKASILQFLVAPKCPSSQMQPFEDFVDGFGGWHGPPNCSCQVLMQASSLRLLRSWHLLTLWTLPQCSGNKPLSFSTGLSTKRLKLWQCLLRSCTWQSWKRYN